MLPYCEPVRLAILYSRRPWVKAVPNIVGFLCETSVRSVAPW